MKKRKTIGDNPLDAVIPRKTVPPAETGGPKKIGKERVTINVTSHLIDKVRNAIFWTPGMTLAQFAEDAFRETLGKMEKKLGKSFPPRKGKLKLGRPLS